MISIICKTDILKMSIRRFPDDAIFSKPLEDVRVLSGVCEANYWIITKKIWWKLSKNSSVKRNAWQNWIFYSFGIDWIRAYTRALLVIVAPSKQISGTCQDHADEIFFVLNVHPFTIRICSNSVAMFSLHLGNLRSHKHVPSGEKPYSCLQ